MKALSAGRVVVIDTDKHRNTLGVILQASPASSKERTFSVLVICEQDPVTSSDSENFSKESADWQMPQPVLNSKLFQPEGPCGHKVVKVRPEDIAVITVKTLKVNAEKIIDDVHKRTIPRFR